MNDNKLIGLVYTKDTRGFHQSTCFYSFSLITVNGIYASYELSVFRFSFICTGVFCLTEHHLADDRLRQ